MLEASACAPLRTRGPSGKISGMELETCPYRKRVVGWGMLLIALPLAFFAAFLPPNEYKATLGVAALDCDGPRKVFGFCALSLLIYGIGFIFNAIRWRSRWNLGVAITCLLICVAVGVNYYRAMLEDDAQRVECQGD